MKKHKLKALSIALLLVGCSGTGGNNSHDSVANEEAVSGTGTVYLDQLSVVPVRSGYKSSYILRINNGSGRAYTIESAKVTNVSGSEDLSSLVKLVASVGKVIPANGSSSIQFSPQIAQSGDVLLTVTLKSANGEIETLHQLIRMSDKVGSSSGLGAVNDINHIISKDGSYSISVPIILTEDFDEVSAKNGSVLCSAAGFKKGNSCTLLLKGNTLSDHAIVNTRVSAFRSGAEVAHSDGSVAVDRGSAANLLISHGVTIKADGKETKTVAIFNSGNAEASALQLADLGKALSLENGGNCATNLAANAACEYKIKASSEVNGSQYFSVSYVGGLSSEVSTNVSYKAEKPDMAIDLLSQNGDLIGTLINDGSSTLSLRIKNSSNRDLYDLRIQAAAAAAGFSVTHNCTGEKGSSCDIELSYDPAQEVAKTDLNLNITGKYRSVDGIDKQYFTTLRIPYSAVLAKDILTISSTDAGNLKTIVNQAAAANFTLHNNAKKIETPITDLALVKGVPGLSLDLAGCKDGNNFKTLAGGANCGVVVNYAAQIDLQSATKNNLKASYTVNSIASSTQSAEFISEVVSGARSFIVSEVTVSEAPKTLNGNGLSSNTPYQFTALKNNRLKLKYTFTNKGQHEASNFNVTGLPAEAEVVAGNTCGYGTDKSTLKNGDSCIIELSIPSTAFIDQQASFENDKLLMADVVLPVSYTYSDTELTSASEERSTAIRRYVSFNRQWATVDLKDQQVRLNITNSADKFWLAKYKVGVNVTKAALDNGLVSYPLKVTPVLLHNPGNAITLNSCTIQDATVAQECEATVKFPLNVVAENNLKLELEVAGNTMTDEDKLYQPVYADLKTTSLIEVNPVKPLVVNPNGTEITINNKLVAVGKLPDTLPTTLSGEKPQITNAFSLGDNSNLALAQTNSDGNQLVVVKTDGSAVPVVLPVPPKDPAKPIVMEVLSTTLGGKPVVSGRDLVTGSAQYATIDAEGNLQVLGDPATPITYSSDRVGVELPDGKLLINTGGVSYIKPMYVLGVGYQKPLHEWLDENGYDYKAAWRHQIPMSGHIVLAVDNNIYIANAGSSVTAYMYQLDIVKKSMVQVGDGAISNTITYGARMAYVDPAQDIYYVTLHFGDQGRNGGLFMLQGKSNKWVELSAGLSTSRYRSPLFIKKPTDVYPTIYTLSNVADGGVFRSNGKDELELLNQTKGIYFPKFLFLIRSDSDGDVYTISVDDKLVRLTATEEVKIASLPANQSIQPTGYFDTRMTAARDGKIYVKAVDDKKNVTIYVYNKESNLLVPTAYKDLPL